MAGIWELLIGGAAAGAGFVLGAGGALASSRELRPLVKQAMKGYLTATDRAREASALMAESLEDMYAEAKAEHESEAAGIAARTPMAAPSSATSQLRQT